MRERPNGITDEALTIALADGWGITTQTVEYLPIGAGGYHWSAGSWFVTVGDQTEQALAIAATLHTGLDFIVAPIRSTSGQVTRRLGEHHALSVYPFVTGTSGSFGPHPVAERDAVLDMLIALHQATPLTAATAARTDLQLPGRNALESALADLGRPWTTGPYAEAARRLLAEHAAGVTERLARRDALIAVLPPEDRWVITHGEPHPGNVLRTADGLRLIDWDTVGLAPPERDLWMLTSAMIDAPRSDDVALLDRYRHATGHQVSPAAIEFYRHWWILADIASYTEHLRRPHTDDADASDALSYLAAGLRAS
jgi:spectinomycin phosphotransferase